MRQRVEYGAFLHWQPQRRILCFSPELFFRLDEASDGGARRIVTQPMKGTAPRGRTLGEDRRMRGMAAHGREKSRRKRDDRRPAAQRSGPPVPVWQRPRGEPLRAWSDWRPCGR